MHPRYRFNFVALSSAVLAVIFVLLPVHALLTVWAASLVGHYELLRVWKEILLVLLVPIVCWIVYKTSYLWKELEVGWLFWAIVFYAFLHGALGVLALAKRQVNVEAFEQALILNLRPFLIFILALVIASQSEWLKIYWRRLLLWPAVVVVAFGLLQIFVLKPAFLQHFGYGPTTIMPFETINQNARYIRIQSTLRGSNPLGAYMVIIISAIVVALLRRRMMLKKRISGLLFLLASIIVLGETYSRSAYIGTILSSIVLFVVLSHTARPRRWFVIGCCITIMCIGVFAVLRHNSRFENTFFHTDQHSTSLESSNEVRGSAELSGLRDVLRQPFGLGPGSAGPASAHNVQPAHIAENYYLQIGQEVGWLGLGLFIAINYMVVKRLWIRRSDPLARTLLVSFFGLIAVNMVSHAWTDDTLALVWWGFAGVALAPAILPVVTQEKHTIQKK